MTLVAAILLLLLPALIEGRLRRWPAFAALLDGVMLSAIAGLFGLFILPHALEAAGGVGVVALMVGLLAPLLAEKLGVREPTVDGASAIAGQLALLLHAALDGVSLAAASHGAPALGFSVLLHQVPVGLGVYSFQRGRFGLVSAVVALVGMALATALGFWAGEGWTGGLDPVALGALQALGAGAILHMFGHGPLPGAAGRPRVSGLGALGVLLFLGMEPLLEGDHHHGEVAVHEALGRGLVQAAPALLLGLVALGLSRGLAPTASAAAQSLATRLFMMSTTCACQVAALGQWFRAGGIAAPAALAVMLLAPALAIEGLFLQVVLLGPRMTLYALTLSCLAAALVIGLVRVRGREPGGVWRAGGGGLSVVDHVGPWVVAGLCVGAVWGGGTVGLTWGEQVGCAVLVGLSARFSPTFLVLSFLPLLSGGLHPSAVLVLLVLGPALSTGGIIQLARNESWFAAACVVVIYLTVALTGAWGVGAGGLDLVLGGLGVSGAGGLAAAVVVVLLLARSLVVAGPRAWLGHLDASAARAENGTAHQHDHGHGHGHG